MRQKHSRLNSYNLIKRTEDLINTGSNRYRVTAEVANRANRFQDADFDNIDDPLMKPVIKAIIEMSGEPIEAEGFNESKIYPKPRLKTNPQISTVSPSASLSGLPSSISETKASSEIIAPLPSSISETKASSEIIPASPNVSRNIFEKIHKEANKKAWNYLVEWTTESVLNISRAESKKLVERFKLVYSTKNPRDIAQALIVKKSLQGAGVDLIKGIPLAEYIITGLGKYDLPEISKLAAELVYQIAGIYGFDLSNPERKTEALMVFSLAFLGEQAIEAGIDWLKYGVIPTKVIKAGAKALMIFAVGNTACLFYEAKIKSNVSPLKSLPLLNKIREESQHYLDNATSTQGIQKLISREIQTVFTVDYTQLKRLLKSKKWKEADRETSNIILQIASQTNDLDFSIIPGKQLTYIDKLWKKRSKNKFGFSIQKTIYLNSEKKVGYFGEKVGWRGKAGVFQGFFAWKSYEKVIFNLNQAPKGHLPALPLYIDKNFIYETTRSATYNFADSILERNDW